MEKLNLYQRINEIRKKVDYIQKDKSVSTGGGSYKAVTHDQVTAILREHMIAQGVICIPSLVASTANDRVGDAKQFRYDATYSFEFVNADKPDERLAIVIEAHAMDNADKAPGKAISYAKKYAVLKLFEIETGEDEESRYQPEETISDEQMQQIVSYAQSIKSNMIDFRKKLHIDRLESLPAGRFGDAMAILNSQKVTFDHAVTLRDCKTIRDLSLAWSKLDKGAQHILSGVKDECKNAISKTEPEKQGENNE